MSYPADSYIKHASTQQMESAPTASAEIRATNELFGGRRQINVWHHVRWGTI